MPRYDVYEESDEYIKSWVIDAPNQGIARGIAAERYKRNPAKLQAMLQDEGGKAERAIALANRLHSIALDALICHQQAQTPEQKAYYSALHKALQGLAISAYQEADYIDAQAHIEAVAQFERHACHPHMLLPKVV